jgi:CheY-like chemotaxis protein
LNNAAKYTPAGGRIELAAVQRGDEAVVTVRDNGVGIPRDMLQRIFEMFAQVQRPRDRSISGLGIGLTLVKKLVELHGGQVAALSAGENRGSTFVVRLPLTTPSASAFGESPPSEAEMVAAMRLLVVDDNRDAAELMAELLRESGHEVRVAYDGAGALAEFQNLRPHAVLLDIGLPDIDGCDVARRIRTIPGGAAALLVALTGWGQPEDHKRSVESGFDHHLVKPVDLEALEGIFRNYSLRGDRPRWL